MSGDSVGPLSRFFAGLTEYVFMTRVGLADPPLMDYVSDLLLRSMRQDGLVSLRGADGRPISDLPGMLSEAETREGFARRTWHRRIGDFTLFWAGLYPESLSESSRKGRYENYCQSGKRAYLAASEIDLAEELIDGELPTAPTGPSHSDRSEPTSDVLRRLAEEFEALAYGLREVRREWEQAGPEDLSGPFLIQ